MQRPLLRPFALVTLVTGLAIACADPAGPDASALSARRSVEVGRAVTGDAAHALMIASVEQQIRTPVVGERPVVRAADGTPLTLEAFLAELRATPPGPGTGRDAQVGTRPNLRVEGLSFSTTSLTPEEDAILTPLQLPVPTGVTYVPLSYSGTPGQTGNQTTNISARTTVTAPPAGASNAWEAVISTNFQVFLSNSYIDGDDLSAVHPTRATVAIPVTHQDCRISIIASSAHQVKWVDKGLLVALREGKALVKKAYTVTSGDNGICDGEDLSTHNGQTATGTGGGGTVEEVNGSTYIRRICTTWYHYSASNVYLGKTSGGCRDEEVQYTY